MSEWIDVKDRLPTEYEDVLFFYSNKLILKKNEMLEEYIWIGRYCNCGGWIKRFPSSRQYYLNTGQVMRMSEIEKLSRSEQRPILYWMPLPEMPKD